MRAVTEIGVGLEDEERLKRASFRLKRGRRELATLVAAVVVLPVRVLMRLVEANEADDEDDAPLVMGFLREERAGGGAIGDDVRRGSGERVLVTRPAAICCTVGGALEMVPTLNSGILICAAAVSSAVEPENEAEGADFFVLNDRFTELNTLSAALGVDDPLAPSGPRADECG